MDQIPWAAIDALTPSGMLMLAVMVKARDDWQSTAQKKQEIIHTLAETVREQSVVSQTAAKVMTAVQEANQAGDTP